MDDKQRWAAIKEIIDAMQLMDEGNRQFILGYMAGVTASAQAARPA